MVNQRSFRDVFSKIVGYAPTRADGKTLMATWCDTPLGPVLAIADENCLYLLEFVDQKGLKNKIVSLRKRLNTGIAPGDTKITQQIKTELADYFSGKCLFFNTPIYLLGSEFQKKVWHTLQTISIGQTRSYLDIAKVIEHPKAYRAVANANGANQLALIIPCHRVINTNGELGGYAGGVSRKAWLLKHEKDFK